MMEADGDNSAPTTTGLTKRPITDKPDKQINTGHDEIGDRNVNDYNDNITTNNKRSKVVRDTEPKTDDFLMELLLLQRNTLDPTEKRELHMSLDAIFYPKFENELSDQNIRQQMLTNVSTQKGYLEISLKHSGSLILWNGATFYSKNSTNNIFTYTAEILLRQHFAKLWFSSSFGTNSVFHDCAAYLQAHHLCLSFECVTSFLGHHGDIPKRDFLILTSVADLREDEERFFTTYELINFAHRWRLPHNDVWIYTSPDRCLRIFNMYDNTRETATAQDTVERLCECSNMYIPCMFPHNEFQGDILEGIVIRYLDYCEDNTPSEEVLVDLGLPLAQESRRIAATAKEAFQQHVSDTSHSSVLLETNLRGLFSTCMSGKTALQAVKRALQLIDDVESPAATDTAQQLPVGVSSTLLSSNKFHKCLSSASGTASTVSSNFESLVSNLVCQQHASKTCEAEGGSDLSSFRTIHLSKDDKTQRVAKLIHMVHQFSLPVRYSFFRSVEQPFHWIFLLQVRDDSVFAKYRRNVLSSLNDLKNSESQWILHLYRGFAVRLNFEESRNEETSNPSSSLHIHDRQATMKRSTSLALAHDAQPLMLKMKFLPYMVRTFGIRNGLSILKKSGIIAFDQYIANLLTKWNISQNSSTKWRHILHCWGKYAAEKMQEGDSKMIYDYANEDSHDVEQDLATLHLVVSDTNTKGDRLKNNLPLNSSTYLYHLRDFFDVYDGSHSQQELASDGFNALIFVVCFDQKYAQLLSDALSQVLVCPCVPLLEMLEQKNLVISSDAGFVSPCSVTVGAHKIRPILTKYQQRCIVLFLSPTNEELHEGLLKRLNDNDDAFDIEKEKKKILGMSLRWKTLQCAMLESGPLSSIFSTGTETPEHLMMLMRNELIPGHEVSILLEDLKKQIDSIPKPDLRPGILVYFPLIPGSGKSTWCEAFSFIRSGLLGESATIFQGESCRDEDNKFKVSAMLGGEHRDVVLQMSDQLKGEKFWPFVRHQKTSCTSSIYIADKNAPPNAWHVVQDIASESRSFGIAVLPDSTALATTSVIGNFLATDGAGKSRSTIRHSYPFSLAFLAVCISRVLSRPLTSHPGKLDSATKNACLVVVQFFSFYRGLTAELLEEQIYWRNSSIVRIPFFLPDSSVRLPEELEQCLIDALRLQFEIDKRGEGTISAELTTASTEIEHRLRALVTKHTPLVQSFTVPVEMSQKSFIVQLSDFVSTLLNSESSVLDIPPTVSSKTIQIVSIDIDVNDVHRLVTLESLSNADLANFIQKIGGLNKSGFLPDKCVSGEICQDENKYLSRCIMKTHVTMVHCSQLSQYQMRSTFESFLGMSFDVSVSGIHFSTEVAALDVTLIQPITATGPTEVEFPQPTNVYPHITVWCSVGVEPYQSNSLPEKLMSGEASRILFDKPTVLRGILSFWEE